MSEAGYFASRLKTALTPDIARPLVPELHDITWGYHTALSHHTILSAFPVAAAPPVPPKHPASRCPQWTHQLFPLALIQLFSLHRLQVRLSYFSANCTDEDQHRGWSPLSAGGRHQSGLVISKKYFGICMCCCLSLACQDRRHASFAFLTPNAEGPFIFPHQESYSHR